MRIFIRILVVGAILLAIAWVGFVEYMYRSATSDCKGEVVYCVCKKEAFGKNRYTLVYHVMYDLLFIENQKKKYENLESAPLEVKERVLKHTSELKPVLEKMELDEQLCRDKYKSIMYDGF